LQTHQKDSKADFGPIAIALHRCKAGNIRDVVFETPWSIENLGFPECTPMP
jgi:hypothetical protein